ncbi:dolichyl-phosphate-mannose--protein mannosyltransferase [Actinocorallia populi]|uniref:dolichyl-phosphate-mannose--protein mannosyltransferase n=1 Tax=Actinocorallia populi TaxID=2079200 RepID=UPI000D08B0E5|nr:phospholipid carrier-dependent glycosyltransferase [Actinocorallia populi]
MATATTTGREERRAGWARRLAACAPDWGWLGPLIVAAYAFTVVFVRLGDPHELMWDETYYAKDAWALLHSGVELAWRDQPGGQPANGFVMAGNPEAGLRPGAAGHAVHPPAGKWLIALGIAAFGMDPFGWRAAAGLAGMLIVLITARTARRMTGSTPLGCAAGLLVALDGSWLVAARVSMLDVFLALFVVAGFGCLVVDRDLTRAALADRARPGGFGPFLWRPWRIAAAVCLGLACCTKWAGLYALVFFWLLALLWDRGARAEAGVPRPWSGTLLLDVVPSFLTVWAVAAATYLAGWWGWFVSGTGLQERLFGRTVPGAGRLWAQENPSSFWPGFLDPLRSLWHRHAETLEFHRGVTGSHPAQSWPWEWLYLGRPAGMHFQVHQDGREGCTPLRQCVTAVTDLGTPAIWWAALPALAALFVLTIRAWDWRSGTVLWGWLAGVLPWLPEAAGGRVMFSTYALPLLPFTVLALVLLFAKGLEAARDRTGRRMAVYLAGAAYLGVVAWNFWYLYPVLTADLVPYASWSERMWFPRWS